MQRAIRKSKNITALWGEIRFSRYIKFLGIFGYSEQSNMRRGECQNNEEEQEILCDTEYIEIKINFKIFKNIGRVDIRYTHDRSQDRVRYGSNINRII